MASNSAVVFALLLSCTVLVVSGMELKGIQRNRDKATKSVGVGSRRKAPVKLVKPEHPDEPDCYQYIPDSPGWDTCFLKYRQEIAKYEREMDDYYEAKSGIWNVEGIDSGGGGSGTRTPNLSLTNGISLSSPSGATVDFDGYAIQTPSNIGIVNIRMSNGRLKFTLKSSGLIDSFQQRVSGSEILLQVLSRGLRTATRLIVPEGIRVGDVKIRRFGDDIRISAPTNGIIGFRIVPST